MSYLKGTPMSKKEVHLLLDLVASKPILTSKNTKASVNKLKKRAWAEIEVEFNAKNEQTRPKDQLSLRWANLKKTCRKKVKNCGGNIELADKEDGILERVIGLLDGSLSTFDVIDTTCDEVSDSNSYGIDDSDTTGLSEAGATIMLTTDKLETQKRKYPGTRFKDGKRERNLAMAEYFEKKAKKLEIEIKLIKLEFFNKKRKVIADKEDI